MNILQLTLLPIVVLLVLGIAGCGLNKTQINTDNTGVPSVPTDLVGSNPDTGNINTVDNSGVATPLADNSNADNTIGQLEVPTDLVGENPDAGSTDTPTVDTGSLG